MIVDSPFTRFPVVFVRLKGKNGSVTECRALIDPVSDYCVIPRPDAFRLGYHEAAHDDPITMPPNLVTMNSSVGFSQGMLIRMQEAALGDYKVENVDFVVFDLPAMAGYDVILGRSFLSASKCRLELDYYTHSLRLSRSS